VQFPESVEIGEVAKEVDSAFAEPETTGTISAISHAVAEARRIEESGRVREALVAWRGVRLLSPSNEDARGGEERTSVTVARAEALLEEGTDLVRGGDAESALLKLDEANAILPGDPVVEGRRREASLLAAELRNELAAIDAELNDSRAETALPRLRALSERYPRSRSALEALSRAEKAGSEANRGVARERVAKAITSAKAHEQAGRARDAARAWREAATLDPDSTDAVAGVARAERSIAEFEALLGQSRKLLSAGDPEGAERTAADALAIIAADPAGEAQLARSRTQVETLRHEAERVRTALAREPDDDVLSWARELASNYSGSPLAADVLRETELKFKEVEDKASEKRASVHVKRAKKLEADGNLPLALGAWQEALRIAPEHADAKAAVARITGRFEKAKALAEDAARLLESGDPDAARAAAEESLSLLADQREASGTLAGARTALDEIDRAAKAFNAVLALDRAEQQHERLKRLAAKYPASAQCTELVGKAEEAIAAAREHARTAKVRAFATDARAALEDGRLADADRAAGEALALDASDAAAQAVRSECAERTGMAKARVAEGEKALGEQRFAEASAAFVAALEADPRLEAAAAGRATAQAAIKRASAELAATVEKAVTATRTGPPVQAVVAWRAVLALDPAHAQAASEIERLTRKIEAARAELARGRAALEAGDPESAVRPLDAAHSVLGAEADEPLAAARERASEISQTVRIIETWLAAPDVSLDDAARDASALLARYPKSGRVRELESHATSAAAERRRSLAVTQIRRLVRDRRFGEARDLAASLRAKGVVSAELDAAAAQAEQAIAKLDDLRTRADKARGVGDLAGARDALKELLVSLPDDADIKARVTELEETIREVTARRDAAETAQRRGAIAQAVDLYREAIALTGSDPELTARIVELEAAVKERARLFAACDDAMKRGDGRACAESAAALLEQYPDDDDARDLQTTGESLDKMVTALFARAQRQVSAGDRKGAEATVECLLRVAPGHDGAAALLRKRPALR
jgi:tetratricopeptide (TPR) repeat protein